MKKLYPTSSEAVAYWIIAGWLAAISVIAAVAV